MKSRTFLCLFIVLFISACATRPTAPESELGAAQSALTAAEDAGATEHARERYQTARNQFERAQRARAAENYVLSRHLAVEASTQARYAAVTARANRTLDLISELQMSNDDLRAEIQAATEAMAEDEMQ